jgi:hypothetical protein
VESNWQGFSVDGYQPVKTLKEYEGEHGDLLGPRKATVCL